MNNKRIVVCGTCEEVIQDDLNVSEKTLKLCPNCSSIKQIIYDYYEEEKKRDIKERVVSKIKDTTKTGKKKLRKEFVDGDDLHRKSGNWYLMKRIIDKDNDYYLETITDRVTGDIIYHCEEPLSKHRGHGSAKMKMG